MKKRLIILLVLICLLIPIGLNARIYSSLYHSGISWDIGGIELRGDPGIFLCQRNYNPETEEYTENPLANLFPNLVTDC